MTTLDTAPSVRESTQVDAPTVIVSTDTHIGPSLDQLRPYCESKYLDDFDRFAAAHREGRAVDYEHTPLKLFSPTNFASGRRAAEPSVNLNTAGHHDVHARLRDLNDDGVAAEVIFHNSQNGQPLPMNGEIVSSFDCEPGELAAAGRWIYNRWLADFCSVEPERHAGLAQLPIYDLDETVKVMKWARENGLRGANFPAMRQDLPLYNDPCWEPLWSAAEEYDLPLCNHGGGFDQRLEGPGAMAVFKLENGEFYGRRMVWWLIFAGVFTRHPNLKLVLTEQPGAWFAETQRRLDSVLGQTDATFEEDLPELPSTYMRRQVFIGGSFLAHFEVEDAVAQGYVDNLTWGSDYPHREGTWRWTDDPGQVGQMTRAAMRMTFADVAPRHIRKIAGENAIRIFGLDSEALSKVATRIGAPRPEYLAQGLDQRPPHADATLSFRHRGTWS